MHPLRRLAAAARHPFSRMRSFRRAREGVAAVEFALILWPMLLLYLGMTELTFAVNTDRKLTLLSRTLADLVGRTPSMSTDSMSDIFKASTAVMVPYQTNQTNMVVSSVVVKPTGAIDGQGNPVVQGRVCWSEARGPAATAIAKNTIVDVPDGFKNANTSFIRADVKLDYAPVFGSSILNWVTKSPTLKLGEQTPWPVRNATEVSWPSRPDTDCL